MESMEALKRKQMLRTHWITSAIICIPGVLLSAGCLLLGVLVGEESGMGAALGSGVLMLLSIFALGGVVIYLIFTTVLVALLNPERLTLIAIHGGASCWLVRSSS